MKFGKFLLASRVKGWEEYYVDYKLLCKCIKTDKAVREEKKTRALTAARGEPAARHSLEDDAAEPGAVPGETEALLDPVDFHSEFLSQVEHHNRYVHQPTHPHAPGGQADVSSEYSPPTKIKKHKQTHTIHNNT